MATRTQVEEDRARSRIERVPWPRFHRWLRRNVKAGEHAVLIGSTGSGKSFLAREVVPLFGRNVVILDGKGGDDPSLDVPGFRTITKWPAPEERWNAIAATLGRERRPIRVRLAPPKRTMEDLSRNRMIFSDMLTDLFTRRGQKVFALYIDEMGELADQRKMNLGQEVELLLQQMRYRGGSVITSMQWPAWLPKSAYRETTHRFIFRVADEDSRKYLASLTGRRKEVDPVMADLPRFHFVYHHVAKDVFITSKVAR